MIGTAQIKQAERGDLYEIAVFLHDSWKAEYRQIVSDDFLDAMSIEERHTGLLKLYDKGLSEFLMMLDGNRMIGAVVFGKSFTEGYEDDGEVSAIYLHSDYIGKGYGHNLFIETERLLRGKGYKNLVLDLLTDNTRALKFYLKHGYKKVADRAIRLGEKEYPLVVLRKTNNVRDMTDEERTRLFPIILSEYNSDWPEWYAEEKERLTRLIGGDNITRITHIGSTSVPGLMAKPTVDILLEITENTDTENLIALLPEDEYICRPNQTIPTNDSVLFLKGYTGNGFAEKVFHIHVRGPGEWDELYFRDYLITHPEAADAYGALKRGLKEKFKFDRDGYTEAKGEFIRAITKKAKE